MSDVPAGCYGIVIGYEFPRKDMGPVEILGMEMGYPPGGSCDLSKYYGMEMGYPPFRCEQTENITFPHPSDGGGKNEELFLPMNSMKQEVHEQGQFKTVHSHEWLWSNDKISWKLSMKAWIQHCFCQKLFL